MPLTLEELQDKVHTFLEELIDPKELDWFIISDISSGDLKLEVLTHWEDKNGKDS